MIQTDEQFRQVIEQIGRMYRALAALRAEVLPQNPRQFALMAEGPLEEIRRLQAEIDAYTGAAIAEENSADVWLQIKGRGVEWPDTPISVLTAFLDSFRKGVQVTATFIATGRVTTRPTAELKQACDLRVMALQPGSLRIGARLPDEAQLDLPFEPGPNIACKALAEYLEVAAWIGSEQELSGLEQRISDPQKRRLLLNALKQITPSPRGNIESVEISGRSVPDGKKINLTRQVNRRIDQAIDRTVAEQVETYTGDLREIDLDNLSFILRNLDEVQEIRCSFEDDLLETAKGALDRRVQVTGVRRVDESRRSYATLRVTRLEVLDEQATEGLG